MDKRKKRTREHIIADLSANYVEKYILVCGFTMEKFEADYGYDLNLYTYSKEGEIENGAVYIQLKATDKIEEYFIKRGTVVSFPLEKQHLEHWLNEPLPVMLIIYDSIAEKAYWIYIQSYFQKLSNFKLEHVNKFHSVHVPIVNRVNKKNIRKIAEYKQKVLNQIDSSHIIHEA